MKKFIIPAFLFLVSCAVVPLTGRKQFVAIPSAQMISLSAESYSKVLAEGKLSSNRQYVNSVRNVGERLTASVEAYLEQNNLASVTQGYEWQYNVLVSEDLNAWCMPGGQIAFYEGILPVCQDENGIAVVMGHEIAHAVAQHGNERLSQQLAIQMGGMALSEALENQKEQTQYLAMLAFGVGATLGWNCPIPGPMKRKPMSWDCISWPWPDMIRVPRLLSGSGWKPNQAPGPPNSFPPIPIHPTGSPTCSESCPRPWNTIRRARELVSRDGKAQFAYI
jgi:hypothetical protein